MIVVSPYTCHYCDIIDTLKENVFSSCIQSYPYYLFEKSVDHRQHTDAVIAAQRYCWLTC